MVSNVCLSNVLNLGPLHIGWHGFGGDQTPGVQFDRFAGRNLDAYMDLPGLVKTLEDSLAKTGLPKFDLVGFDACSMASTVVTAKIAKYADVLVYAEDTEPGHGWEYEVFKDVVATPSLDAAEVGVMQTELVLARS